MSEKKSTETKSSVDTSSLEKNDVSASTVTTDKSAQASNTNKADNNAAASTERAANASAATKDAKSSTTVNNTEKAAAKLAEDANVNTDNITKSTVSNDTTITKAGQAGKQDSVDTQNIDLNTATLGKLTKSSDSHFDPKLAALLGTSLIQTDATNAVTTNTLNTNGAGNSSLTNANATALAASLKSANGNNDTSDNTIKDFSDLQKAVTDDSIKSITVTGEITATGNLNINRDVTIVGADKNASIKLNSNEINNTGNLTLKDINIDGSITGNGTVKAVATTYSGLKNLVFSDSVKNVVVDNAIVADSNLNVGHDVTITNSDNNSGAIDLNGNQINNTGNLTLKDITVNGSVMETGTVNIEGNVTSSVNDSNGYNLSNSEKSAKFTNTNQTKGYNIEANRVNVDRNASLTINRSSVGDGIHLVNNGSVNVADYGQLTINMNTNNDLNTIAHYHDAGIFAEGNW